MTGQKTENETALTFMPTPTATRPLTHTEFTSNPKATKVVYFEAATECLERDRNDQ